MLEGAYARVVAHTPETREAVRTGHDHKLIVRAELGVANDIRMRKSEQKLTFRQLPDAGGAFSLVGILKRDGDSFRLAGEQEFSARLKRTCSTLFECRSHGVIAWPVSKFQTRAVASREPVATRVPSGLSARSISGPP